MAFVKKSQRGIASAIRSFRGHLEGTEKSVNTIKNYLSDLSTFEQFLEQQIPGGPRGSKGARKILSPESLNLEDLEQYGDWLKAQGLKNNSRRRKLLTVKRFLKYLQGRGKIKANLAPAVAAPWRIERIPAVPNYFALYNAIVAMPGGQILLDRNRLLLWVLLETGAQVNEVVALRFSQLVRSSESGVQEVYVEFFGKAPRKVPVTESLYLEVQKFQIQHQIKGEYLFSGFNRFGTVSGAMTTRAAEIIFKSATKTWEGYWNNAPVEQSASGKPGSLILTPRSLRHSAVIHWYTQGKSDHEVQGRLGLKTPYSLKLYHAYLQETQPLSNLDPAAKPSVF